MADKKWTDVTQAKPFLFKNVGDSLTGFYVKSFDYEDNFGNQKKGYIIKNDNGLNLAYEGGNLRSKMENVSAGDEIRVTYTGQVDIGKPQKMHDYKVEIAG